MYPSRIYDQFPAPEFRGNQKQALSDIESAFESGAKVVLVRAPTGSGKSLLARAIAGCARTVGEAGPEQPIDAFYTTPQVSQLDDVEDDEFLDDLQIIRGKNNYNCILPGETNTPVNRAPCVRDRGFDCSVKHRCPYFTDRATAANQRIAAMTLAYFMETAGSDIFEKRDVVVIDEAHGLDSWAEMYATIELSPQTVPMWDDIRIPSISTVDEATDFAGRLRTVADRRLKEIRGKAELSPQETASRDHLSRLKSDLKWFQSDTQSEESNTTWVVDQNGGAGSAISIKPLNPERYLKHTVWDRGEKFALLSATILNKEAFCAKVGLPAEDVEMVEVGHTFPVERRPLYDVTQGKMTYEERDSTLPAIAKTIVRVMAKHSDEKGLIHCHSYAIQEKLEARLSRLGIGSRIRSHDKQNRDKKLIEWKQSDSSDVFLSVKMEEALDLEGDLARWQVICKAPYPNTRDTRVEKRLEDGMWGWYYRNTLETIIQACGRVIRAPDDYGATYLADSSLLDLFERSRTDMPPWFEEQVDRMSVPDLPMPQAVRN